jgi:hypothetical protein
MYCQHRPIKSKTKNCRLASVKKKEVLKSKARIRAIYTRSCQMQTQLTKDIHTIEKGMPDVPGHGRA